MKNAAGTLIVIMLSLIPSASIAWQHEVHKLAAEKSWNTLHSGCRQHLNFNDLISGSVESDIHRTIFRNPSHKKEHARIQNSYNAALKTVTTDRALASRRVARSFHYVLDQSEPDVSLRKRLARRTGLDFREVGWKVLLRSGSGASDFNRMLTRKKFKYSGYSWERILEEIDKIQRRAEKGIRETIEEHRKGNQRFYNVLRKPVAEYLASTLALQNTVMHRYCIEAAKIIEAQKKKPNQKESWCRQYANNAVSQHRQNLQHKCGYGGPRWQDNFDNHYNWCLTASIKRTKAEDKSRQNDVETCRRINARCRAYASTAVAQHRQNLSMGCGYGGPAWQENYNNHYNWCRGETRRITDRETQGRTQALRDCAARKKKK
jgi:hypothetical protein